MREKEQDLNFHHLATIQRRQIGPTVERRATTENNEDRESTLSIFLRMMNVI